MPARRSASDTPTPIELIGYARARRHQCNLSGQRFVLAGPAAVR
jgi:hypothetical protein